MKYIFLLRFTTIIIASGLLFVIFFHPINALNQDLGRHLLLGKIISSNGSVPKINLFSYTYPNYPFINTHWLSEVFYYFITLFLGLNGLLLFSTITACIAFGIIFYFSIKKYNPFICLLTAFLYLQILLERTDIRPEIFSFLFVSIFMIILFKNREKMTNWIYLLPVIEFLWTNMHIYYPVGIALVCLFLADEIVTKKIIMSKKIKRLLIVGSCCIIVTLCNPNGISGALFPLNVFNNYGYSLEENQNIFFLDSLFHLQTVLFFKLSVAFLISLLLITWKKTRAIDWFLLILFSIGAAMAIRNFPLFVFTTFISFCRALDILYGNVSNKYRNNIYFLTFIVLLISILTYSTMHTSLAKNGLGFGSIKGAAEGVSFYQENKIQGPLLNNFDIGSYLEYRLYPKQRVFIDGRPEAFPASFFENIYIPMLQNPLLFASQNNKYNFNSIFFSHTDQTPWAQQFLKNISVNNDWKIVYLDSFSIILVKNNQENHNLITGHTISQSSFRFQSDLSIQDLAQYINVFQLLDWKHTEIEALKRLLNIDSNNCQALSIYINLLQQENDSLSSYYVGELQAKCPVALQQ